FQIERRSADDHLDVAELSRDEVGVRQMSDAKGEVYVLLDHVDGAVDQLQVDRYGGIAPQELRKDRREQQPPDQRGGRDTKPSRRLMITRQCRFDLPELAQDRLGALVEHAAI